MKILVTGGAGFIGSHLCEALLARGDTITVLDNLMTGCRGNLATTDVEFVRGDVCQPFHFEVERIFHLACPASPIHYQRNPVRTIKTAVLGTMHALELARDTGARLLITSTSEVYGDPDVHPQPESYVGSVNPVGPRACYDEGKRCGEALAASWCGQFGTDVRIARIFNTYGPRMAQGDGRLLPTLIGQALRGEPMTLHGGGEQTRSFCYVTDTVGGLMALMDRAGSAPTPVNIGNPDERTVLSVALDVARICGVDASGIQRGARPIDDPERRCPDITLARARLDWEPRVNWETGLLAMVDSMRTKL